VLVVLPHVLKASFIASGEFDSGFLIARKADDSWSDPAFHTLGAANVGLQIGIKDMALVPLVRSSGARDGIPRYQGKLNADIAASRSIRHPTSAGTPWLLPTSILRPNMGDSLEGSELAIRRDLNEDYYGVDAKSHEILSGTRKALDVKRLNERLD